jgi:hypothetical protein
MWNPSESAIHSRAAVRLSSMRLCCLSPFLRYLSRRDRCHGCEAGTVVGHWFRPSMRRRTRQDSGPSWLLLADWRPDPEGPLSPQDLPLSERGCV